MIDAYAYAASRALCREPPVLVLLDVSLAALRENIPLTSRRARRARHKALRHYYQLRARLGPTT